MALLMFISIYTSRVILANLGIEDYGIYNVVGGLTGMFAFFQSSLANATQRFISVELGKGSKDGARKVFSQSFFIYLFFVVIVLIALETVGYWFVVNKLNIPPERLNAALVVFHITIISLCFTLIGTAYNSAIIAHEDMSYYSYIGFFEGIMKLVIAYMISITSYDRLIIYAFLLMMVVVIVQSSYAVICLRNYAECRIKWIYDRDTIEKMRSFFSWNFLSTIIYMTKDQLINILINLFFGPAINAARGISYQINGIVAQFTTSIFTSVQPQIVKSYASRDLSYMHTLIFTSSKFSVIAYWVIALPIVLNIDFLLSLWLKEVPDYTSIFTIWVFVDSGLALLTQSPWGCALATGNLKRIVLFANTAILFVFPISYLFLLLGYSPVCIFVIIALLRFVQVVLMVLQANFLVHFGLIKYFNNVARPILSVLIVSSILPLMVYVNTDNDWKGFLFRASIAVISCIIIAFFLGLTSKEKSYIKNYVKSRINK